MPVTSHFNGVHPGYAIIAVLTIAAGSLLFAHPVYETRFVEQCTCHLYGIEALVQHLVYFGTRNQSAYIYQRNFQLCTKLQGILQKISLFEGNRRYHPFAHHTHSILQPPARHVVRHAANRHFPAHHIHGRFTHKTATQHQSMHARLFETPRHLHRFIHLHASPETVAHVHLHKYSHIVAGSLHHFLQHHIHKTHTVLQRPAEFILTMIGGRRQKLAYEITMSRMDFHSVEPRLTR